MEGHSRDSPSTRTRRRKGLENYKVVEDIPVKVAWDNHGLYFMLDMIDADGKITKSHVTNFAYCDVVEIFLDTMNTKETKRGTGRGPAVLGRGHSAAWMIRMRPAANRFFDRHTGFHFAGFSPAELPHFARPTPNGYQLQFCLPTERVRDADLVPGKMLGLNVTVEPGVKGLHYYWSASKNVGTWARPDTWGDVLLGGSDGRMEFPAASHFRNRATLDRSAYPSAFVVGEPLRIRVIDRDMNLNDQVKDKVSVTVRNGRGEQEVAILRRRARILAFLKGRSAPHSISVNPFPVQSERMKANPSQSLILTRLVPTARATRKLSVRSKPGRA